MEFERIEVFSRDEYRGAQEPQRFCWRDRLFHISRVVDRWYEGNLEAARMPLRYFRVETAEGNQFILRYHEFFHAWSILVPREEKVEENR